MADTTPARSVAPPRTAPIAHPLTLDQTTALRSATASERQAETAEWATGYAEGALVVAALQLALTLFATYFIWRSFQQARAVLQQGEETLRRGQESLQRQLRPYVHAYDARVAQFEVGKPVKVELKYTNTGQSPAVETQVRLMIMTGTTKDAIPLLLPKEHWSRIVLAAGEVRDAATETRWSLGQEQYDDMQVREKLYVLLHGSITYTDTFGEIHITTFSFRSHDGLKQGPAPLQVRPWGNRIDHPDDIGKWSTVRAAWRSQAARIGDLEIPPDERAP